MEKFWWFVIRKLISYVLLFSHLDFSVDKSKKLSDFLPWKQNNKPTSRKKKEKVRKKEEEWEKIRKRERQSKKEEDSKKDEERESNVKKK